MYKVKAEGRNGYRFFNPELDAEARTRHALGHDLREALSRGQFELHYQPLVNLGTEEVVGFEALLRWRHPERGLVLPDEFIVHAEETGLIGPIGEWVLREACSAACKWPDHIRISVNLSSVQFRIRSVATFRCTIGAVFYAAILCFPTSWGCLARSTSLFEGFRDSPNPQISLSHGPFCGRGGPRPCRRDAPRPRAPSVTWHSHPPQRR